MPNHKQLRKMQFQDLRLGINLVTLDLETNAPTNWAAEGITVSLGASSVYIYIYIYGCEFSIYLYIYTFYIYMQFWFSSQIYFIIVCLKWEIIAPLSFSEVKSSFLKYNNKMLSKNIEF